MTHSKSVGVVAIQAWTLLWLLWLEAVVSKPCIEVAAEPHLRSMSLESFVLVMFGMADAPTPPMGLFTFRRLHKSHNKNQRGPLLHQGPWWHAVP